jgi:hypothetical protein
LSESIHTYTSRNNFSHAIAIFNNLGYAIISDIDVGPTWHWVINDIYRIIKNCNGIWGIAPYINFSSKQSYQFHIEVSYFTQQVNVWCINYNYISKINYNSFSWHATYPHYHLINTCHISIQIHFLHIIYHIILCSKQILKWLISLI